MGPRSLWPMGKTMMASRLQGCSEQKHLTFLSKCLGSAMAGHGRPWIKASRCCVSRPVSCLMWPMQHLFDANGNWSPTHWHIFLPLPYHGSWNHQLTDVLMKHRVVRVWLSASCASESLSLFGSSGDLCRSWNHGELVCLDCHGASDLVPVSMVDGDISLETRGSKKSIW